MATRLVGSFPGWLQISLLLLVGAFLVIPATLPGLNNVPRREIAIASLVVLAVLAGLRQSRNAAPGRRRSRSPVISSGRGTCTTFVLRRRRRASSRSRSGSAGIEDTTRGLDEDWKRAAKEALDMLDARPRAIDEQAPVVARKCEQQHRASLAKTERDHADRVARLKRDAEVRTKELAAGHLAKRRCWTRTIGPGGEHLEREWKERIDPIYEILRTEEAAAAALFPEWDLRRWENWTPPKEFANAAKFGRLEVDGARFFEIVPGQAPAAARACDFFGALAAVVSEGGFNSF